MKPILFNGEMVRAILDGRKTQTRRVLKPQPNIEKMRFNGETWEMHMGYPMGHDVPISRYGRVGDCMWVRETWATPGNYDHIKISDLTDHVHITDLYYRASQKYDGYLKWRASIHMPRWASRITLRITDYRIEPLQDISEEDTYAEGITSYMLSDKWQGVSSDYRPHLSNPIMVFSHLWDSVNDKRGFGWNTNLWVEVIEFEVARSWTNEMHKHT